MSEFSKVDTELTLRHAREDQRREAIPDADQTPPPPGSFNVFLLFNLEAAFDEGHAVLALGPVDGPIETYSFYRQGNAVKAPAEMACLRAPEPFGAIEAASGWIIHGQPGNFWNEHMDAALALWCDRAAYEAVRACAEERRQRPGTYNLVTFNCLGFVEEALRAGGIRLVTRDGRDLHTIVPKDAFEDVTAVTGAHRFGAWKYWFPVTPPPKNGLRSIPDEPER